MPFCNSIYEALHNVAGKDSDKLGLAYVYALFKVSELRILSRNPIVDEAQNVYVQLDSIGRTSFNIEPEKYKEIIKQKMDSKKEFLKGTVGETALGLINSKGIDASLKEIGNSLERLLQTGVDSHGREIRAGTIQRYEQEMILAEIKKLY